MGFPEDEADDVVQEFIADKIVEKNLVEKADRSRGKLRTLLRCALENFAMSLLRRQNAQKRRPQEAELRSIERHQYTGPEKETPTDPFDAAWAREVLATALDRMQEYCKDAERLEIWSVFKLRVLRPVLEGIDPLPYDELISRFELESPSRAYNLLATAKRIFRRCLRSVVAEYAGSDAGIDEELRDLRRVLSRSPALLDGSPS
jgi:hypothetical protein